MTHPAASAAQVDPVDANWRILQAGRERPLTPRGLSRLKGNRCSCRDRDPDTKSGEGRPSLKLVDRILTRDADATTWREDFLWESLTTEQPDEELTLEEALDGAETAPPSFAEADGAICVNGQVFFFHHAEEDTESEQKDASATADLEPHSTGSSV